MEIKRIRKVVFAIILNINSINSAIDGIRIKDLIGPRILSGD
jgi:hypothetical protein